MAWFTRAKTGAEGTPDSEKNVRTEGLWEKCEGCGQILWRKNLEESHFICTACGHHFRIDARTRLTMLFDDGQFHEHDSDLTTTDPLTFRDKKSYLDRISDMTAATGLKDSLIAASGSLGGRAVQMCAMELKFVGGSMGAVTGEKITRAIERSIAKREPLVIISASGGARMQEGAVSLMQMAKVSSALMRLDQERIPFISLLTDPTTGGVTASFAMLGDLNIGEPGAQIGFAGPRIIEQTIRQKLPEGFQRSEFLLKHGFLDAVVPRNELKAYLVEFNYAGARTHLKTFKEVPYAVK